MGGRRSGRGLRRPAPFAVAGVVAGAMAPLARVGDGAACSGARCWRTDEGVTAGGVGWVMRGGAPGLAVSGEGAGAERATDGRAAPVAACASESSASAKPASWWSAAVEGINDACRPRRGRLASGGDVLVCGVDVSWARVGVGRVGAGCGRAMDDGDMAYEEGQCCALRMICVARGVPGWRGHVGGRRPWRQRLGGAVQRAGGRERSGAVQTAPRSARGGMMVPRGMQPASSMWWGLYVVRKVPRTMSQCGP